MMPQTHPPEEPNSYSGGMPPMYQPESSIDNVVEQINPQNIIDNFDHALKGEYYNKEKGGWEMNASGKAMVNHNCRGSLISFLTGIMNNASTMGIIDKNQLSFLMEGVIKTITREFRCNLEKFGFVPPGKYYEQENYENKGTPNTSRMDSVAEMIYQRAFLILTRSLKGTESSRIFKSLSMSDAMNYGQQQQRKGFLGKIFS